MEQKLIFIHSVRSDNKISYSAHNPSCKQYSHLNQFSNLSGKRNYIDLIHDRLIVSIKYELHYQNTHLLWICGMHKF